MKFWRQRWQTWVDRRHARSDAHTITQRNLYILPTAAGLAFCATLLLLLLATINEQLSLGYVLTFLLTGAGFASMHSTHANLQGLSLALKPPQPVHAPHQAPLEIRLHNQAAARYGIGIQVQTGHKEPGWVDVPALGHAQMQLLLPPLPRGLHPVPVLHIETRFPLGLFRAWTYWRPASQLLVYPEPEANPPPPPHAPPESQGQVLPHPTQSQPGDETQGLRAYRIGDAPRDIHWKKMQERGDGAPQLWVRERHAPQQHELWLNWHDCAGLNDEARLSRLCAWLLRSEAQGQRYGLSLPGVRLTPDQGASHLSACLRALALHGLPASDTPQVLP